MGERAGWGIGLVSAAAWQVLACASLTGLAGGVDGGDGAPSADASGEMASGGDDQADGGVDAPGDAPACDPPSFCDDFDHGPLGATWSGFNTSADGVLALESTNVRSPPYALSVTLNEPADASVGRQAMLNKSFPQARAVSCSVALYLEQTGAETATVMSIFVDNPFWSGYQFNVLILADRTSQLVEWGDFADGSAGPYVYVSGAPIPLQQWVHAVVTIDYSGSASLYVNGSPFVKLQTYPQTPKSETFYLGLGAGGSGAWSAFFDDVVCTPTL